MAVLYISQDGLRPSGITTYGCHLLAAMPDARMLLLDAPTVPTGQPAEMEARIWMLAPERSHDVAAVAEAIRSLGAKMPGPVVVMPNTGDTAWSAMVALLAEMPGTERPRWRVLGIVHSDVETQYAGAVRHATFAAAWIGVSRRCAEELRRRLGGTVPAGRLHELTYPMPVPAACSGSASGQPIRLVYAGRLEEPQKRVSRLATMLNELAARRVAFTAVIIGDGPARNDFTARVAPRIGDGSVRILGAQDRAGVLAQLLQSDVALLTSAYEGLPLALLEAMGSGVCPVVMRTESGIDDVLSDGTNACVVPQGDVAAMVDVIAGLAADRSRLAKLKAAARACIADAFSPARHFARLAEIVADCIEQPPPDPATVSRDPTSVAVQRLVELVRHAARPVAVYGAGMFGRKVLDACLAAELPVVALVDSDPEREGSRFRGIACEAPASLLQHGDLIVAAGSVEFAGEIRERVKAIYREAGRNCPPIVTCCD